MSWFHMFLCFCVQIVLKVELPPLAGFRWRLPEAHQRCRGSGEQQTENPVQSGAPAPQSPAGGRGSASSQESSFAQTQPAEAARGGGRVRADLEGLLEEPEAPEVPLPEGPGGPRGQNQSPGLHNHRAEQQPAEQTEGVRTRRDDSC